MIWTQLTHLSPSVTTTLPTTLIRTKIIRNTKKIGHIATGEMIPATFIYALTNQNFYRLFAKLLKLIVMISSPDKPPFAINGPLNLMKLSIISKPQSTISKIPLEPRKHLPPIMTLSFILLKCPRKLRPNPPALPISLKPRPTTSSTLSIIPIIDPNVVLDLFQRLLAFSPFYSALFRFSEMPQQQPKFPNQCQHSKSTLLILPPS